jgi:hypothetical protein
MNANSVFSSSLLLINSPQVYSALLTLACQKDLILKPKTVAVAKKEPSGEGSIRLGGRQLQDCITPGVVSF